MSKSISQLKKEVSYYRQKNKIASKKRALESELRRQKYSGLISLGGGAVNFGKAIGKSTMNVGRSLGNSFTGDGLLGDGGYSTPKKSKKRKGGYSIGGIPDDLGF